jgi:hypothetical protein
MPQCPHCQAPYEKGQRYCSFCGSFLLHPEHGDTFCPQCSVRVSPKQEFCHECDAPLKGQAAAAAPSPAPPSAAAAPVAPAAAAPGGKMQPWAVGLLIGTGLAVILLLILLFGRSPSAPPQPKAEAPAVTAPAPSPPAPVPPAAPPAAPPKEAAASLQEQMETALSTLREAQLKKDITKFMSVYSLTFPGLEQKRADTMSGWENFDYTNLVFTVDKVQQIDPDNAIAWVTWYIDTRNRRNQELSSASQTYQVRFAKEMGHWRIRSLQEAE